MAKGAQMKAVACQKNHFAICGLNRFKIQICHRLLTLMLSKLVRLSCQVIWVCNNMRVIKWKNFHFLGEIFFVWISANIHRKKGLLSIINTVMKHNSHRCCCQNKQFEKHAIFVLSAREEIFYLHTTFQIEYIPIEMTGFTFKFCQITISLPN